LDKPILCLDFDGVLHRYDSGWKGASVIPDPPVPGAMDFIEEAIRHFDVHIYSSRSSQYDGIKAMKEYIRHHSGSEVLPLMIKWPTTKPSAFVTIDDRALTFTGTWPSMETLKNFKPWNRT
jgi:hypothetical protein